MLKLESIINDIWQERGEKGGFAAKVAPKLTERQLLELVAFDLFAELRTELRGVSVSFDDRSVTISRQPTNLVEVEQTSAKDDAAIVYDDVPAFFRVRGGTFHPNRRSATAASLLLALQICRDHIDSVIYLPPEMRERRLAAYASDTQMDIDRFRYLAGSYPMLARLIEK